MSINSLVGLLIALIIAGFIFWLVIWFVDYIGIGEPFNKAIKIIVGLIALLYLLGVLTGHVPRFM
jgi:hypothetical protein